MHEGGHQALPRPAAVSRMHPTLHASRPPAGPRPARPACSGPDHEGKAPCERAIGARCAGLWHEHCSGGQRAGSPGLRMARSCTVRAGASSNGTGPAQREAVESNGAQGPGTDGGAQQPAGPAMDARLGMFAAITRAITKISNTFKDQARWVFSAWPQLEALAVPIRCLFPGASFQPARVWQQVSPGQGARDGPAAKSRQNGVAKQGGVHVMQQRTAANKTTQELETEREVEEISDVLAYLEEEASRGACLCANMLHSLDKLPCELRTIDR